MKMNKVECFEDLRIWQDARALVKQVYTDFGVGTPDNKDYGFRDQLQRAGISIMNNIAEGFERKSDTEFARFLDIAKGSAGEVRSMYYAAEDLNYVNEAVALERRAAAIAISKGIGALEGYLRK
ncbi:MAG: four helix bundle protein [Kiritimatiellales bacterium]|nr:four helix bundle protein [Kiritimatiellales bacterium]